MKIQENMIFRSVLLLQHLYLVEKMMALWKLQKVYI